jgi:hypothetical protein
MSILITRAADRHRYEIKMCRIRAHGSSMDEVMGGSCSRWYSSAAADSEKLAEKLFPYAGTDRCSALMMMATVGRTVKMMGEEFGQHTSKFKIDSN